MDKKEIEIKSLDEYIKEVCGYKSRSIYFSIFRGQSKDMDLLPKIARSNLLKKDEILKIEHEILLEFKRKARPYLDEEPKTDLEWIALAQHHGLKTRLLDWTENALTALWFCVGKEPKNLNDNGVVWILTAFDIYSYFVDDVDCQNPFEINYTKIYKPSYFSKRIISQFGIFTVHQILDGKNLAEPLNKNKRYTNHLKKIKIPYRAFKGIKQDLIKCGIHSASIFPDLDGLSLHLNEILESEENIKKLLNFIPSVPPYRFEED